MLISYYQTKESPQVEWLKTTQIYYPKVRLKWILMSSGQGVSRLRSFWGFQGRVGSFPCPASRAACIS